MQKQENPNQQEPSVLISLIPIALLIALMVFNVVIFKDNATFGPNQLALLIASLVAGILGVSSLGLSYFYLEKQIIKSIAMAMQSVLILLVVGSVISIWIASGIVPLMIYYGLEIINPSVFLAVSCLVSCIVSLCTGSSWSTSGTIGIALIAIGQTLGIPVSMVAGAVISGAYFGDKMSPLSDTTNLAPAMAGTDLSARCDACAAVFSSLQQHGRLLRGSSATHRRGSPVAGGGCYDPAPDAS